MKKLQFIQYGLIFDCSHEQEIRISCQYLLIVVFNELYHDCCRSSNCSSSFSCRVAVASRYTKSLNLNSDYPNFLIVRFFFLSCGEKCKAEIRSLNKFKPCTRCTPAERSGSRHCYQPSSIQ